MGATVDVIAPRALILPREENNPQEQSGSIIISGSSLIYRGYDGSGNDFLVTATEQP